MSGLLLVGGVVAAVENTAEHFRMEGLHAAAENRGVAGEVFDSLTLIAKTGYEVAGAASGEELHAAFVEQAQNFIESVLVEDRDKSSFDFLYIGHCVNC